MWKWETEKQPKAVVVIVHSAFEHHRWYAWLIEKLRTEGFHVVMGDLPGHEEGSKYTRVHDELIDEYLLFIKQLMKSALQYQLPVFLIGHGFGGTLAIQFLRKTKPECAGVILSSPWLELQKHSNLLASALASMNIAPNKKISLELSKRLLTRNPNGIEEMADDVPYHSNVTGRWYRDVLQLMRNLSMQQERTLTLPILLMTSGKDKVADSDAARKWLLLQQTKEFQYKDWPHSCHNIFHDQDREAAFLYMKDFINNVLRSIGYIV
ncbi:alpha/beta hydrolase [Ureibacillus sp. FSL K6-8385]|uniref:Alpha/beta hydrolase n=1 Tax=Ureibacillus terrenus TaxID=118246 RepID=A0A540V091_9BACL|nr:alpha/beta hydrolase [Ureibacillus terrenus]MED3662498.1 alpha/beta hydrolase [Ureibacillus terrenus]MED3764854.1 alpha/beta hydrolase [Ureibacillus terrenus]TQE90166.1 alpha/beta hydrolase [Ureibacillus terrenus]